MKKLCAFLACFVFVGVSLLQAQTVQITGAVSSTEEGPLPGVSIIVKGTTVGTTTDGVGNYAINVPANATTLTFSFMGYKTQDVVIAGRKVIDVVLEMDALALEEIVVTALGIKKEKKALGYAVQAVSDEDISRTGNADLNSALQGKLAGIDIKPSSGMPGASAQMVIRGARSFTGNNAPLYVIDGMPIASSSPYSTGNSVTGADVSNRSIDINPADIETIDILKGQAAAALYGIRASNGVIIITTKSGKGNNVGKAVVSISHNSNFSQVSRTPDYQTTWAQGSYGVHNPNASTSWGPKIVDLPNSATYGGNTVNAYSTAAAANGIVTTGKYYVPQLALAGLDPWATPQVYNNWTDYFQTAYSISNNISVSQATEDGSFAIGVSNADQTGIADGTGMTRYTARANAERKLSKNFKTGFSANYATSNIDKLTGANDGSLAGILAAPSSYNLKGTPYHRPGEPTRQIYYRGGSFDNPYWVPENNTFNEKTNRFFGNGYIDFNTSLNDEMNFNIHYQAGADTYSTHLQDIFGYGSRNNSRGVIDNYGLTSTVFNSLITSSFDWKITSDLDFNIMVGSELNHTNTKSYTESGTSFNFPGWNHISNASIVTADENQSASRTVGVFGNLSLSWKSMLYFNATGRNDVVSSMPNGNRTFFYPSASLGFVVSEIEAIKNTSWLSFAKLRASYAEVGQAGTYFENFYDVPAYGGGFWIGTPVQYPINGINSYVPSTTQYDPNLKPQNTVSYEFGVDLKFINNRLGVDYTYSRQNVTDQIFPVPLAGSTGASQLIMNGGKVHTDAHEVVLYFTPVKSNDFEWNLSVNYSKITNVVDELAEGVESIFLGGFTTPQVRAGIGNTYPVIYGSSFVRDDNGKIVVVDSPGAWNHGMPQTGEPGVIGVVSPDFILNGSTSVSYKAISLSAVLEWKSGGQMYSGSNGLLDLYGMSSLTEDRESTFIFDGVKPDGTVNDIVRGGVNDTRAFQDLYSNVLSNIDEYYIHENSFVKLRELSLKYQLPKNFYKSANASVSVFARNILLWTALRNLDPETSQGNNNMGGSFERFSLPQTTTYGFSIDLTF